MSRWDELEGKDRSAVASRVRDAVVAGLLVLPSLVGCRGAGEPDAAPETTVPTAVRPRAPVSASGGTASALDWNEMRAVELLALPLSCIDRPHRRRTGHTGRSYLHDVTETLRDDYEGELAFYGCADWHSAVNSTWAMVKVLEEFPESAVAGLIREKLADHLSKRSLEGELTFFRDVARPGFERPYGWAWLMKLCVELARSSGEEAESWAKNLSPLAELLAERAIEYLDHLSHPIRVGTHDNTAFSLELMLEYAREVGNERLAKAIELRSVAFFADDTACPVAYEPSGSDFLSPCLSEAVLMSRILDDAVFPGWLTQFLPDVQRLGERIQIEEHYLPESIVPPPDAETSNSQAGSEGDEAEALRDEERARERRLAGARSHLIGLAFVRAAALLRLAEALPPEDPRARRFRDLAALQAEHGFATMYDAQYFGSHWLASFAIRMLTAPSEGAR